MEQDGLKKIAYQVSTISIIVNLVLFGFKLGAGIWGKSGAMISDAVHSLSDIFSTFVVMIGIKIAARNPDETHPYGHERMECVAAILLAVLLALTGVGIGMAGLENITANNPENIAVPGRIALAAALVSIVVKEIMFWYTKIAAQKLDSGALMADAWHHRSDALSSVGSFIGVFGARAGYPILDSVASVFICLFIIKAAFDIFFDAVNKMTDHGCDKETTAELEQIVLSTAGVVALDVLKTRLFSDKIYVDVEIQADGEITLNEAHEIAQEVHDKIEQQMPKVKHCMVHINPAK